MRWTGLASPRTECILACQIGPVHLSVKDQSGDAMAVHLGRYLREKWNAWCSAFRAVPRRRRLYFEPLEQRAMLSVSASTPPAVSADWFAQIPRSSVQYPADFIGPRVLDAALAYGPSTGDWIVQFKPEAAATLTGVAQAQQQLNNLPYHYEVERGLGAPGLVLVHSYGVDATTAAATLRGLSAVSYVEANGRISGEDTRLTPNDPSFTSKELIGLDNDGTIVGTADADINAPEAWAVTTGSRSIVVAVLDSGIDYNHPDLTANIWVNSGEMPNNGIDDDNNGFVDDYHGYDFHNNDGDPMDDHRHGTHVAGTIGAVGNNGIGVTGVAWQTTLLPVKFLDENNAGSTDDAVAAINYLVMLKTTGKANVRVVNNSWGTTEYKQSLYDAISRANAADILFVCAAGNGDALGNGIDLDQPNQNFYPATLDLPNIISVAASDPYDQLAPFSNYGVTKVDIAAPGVGILSTFPGGAYATLNGTSMATPHVTGTAALVLALHPDATTDEIKNSLVNGAVNKSALQSAVLEGRRLDALNALSAPVFAPHGSVQLTPSITQASTHLVADLNKYPAGSGPQRFESVGSTLFFTANDRLHGEELWRSDGTSSGTAMVRDVNLIASANISHMVNVNGTLYFNADDNVNGNELWRSNGTSSGTAIVRDINAGSFTAHPSELTNVNGVLYFSAYTSVTGYDLWRSDGTCAGTTIVRDFNTGLRPRGFSNVNGILFFSTDDGNTGHELWRSDGTCTGTYLVREIQPGVQGGDPQQLINIAGTLYFAATNGINGYELWRSDGTSTGTVLVRDINIGSVAANPSQLTNVNGVLYFSANDGINGYELWRSDGTSSGTIMVRNINAGNVSANPAYLTNINGTLYFQANDGINGSELWQSNGTSSGTSIIKDIQAGVGGGSPTALLNFYGTLFFSANDGLAGYELWRSDGTSSGTMLVRDIQIGFAGAEPGSLVNVGGMLYLSANDGIVGKELWCSDGTSSGTTLVRDIRGGTYGAIPVELTNVNGVLYFHAYDRNADRELLRSDGTSSGTTLVRDIQPGPGRGLSTFVSAYLTNLGGVSFFRAEDGTNGGELWRSDGTSSGTVLVRDINIGSSGSNPSYLTNVNGVLFFTADDGVNGRELWRSDGTSSGTTLVRDIAAGNVDGAPRFFTNVNGILFFAAFDVVRGTELWRSDGTSSGTTLVRDIWLGSSSDLRYLTNVNGLLFFQANDGFNGAELWRSDGTSSGTTLVRNIRTGSVGSGSYPARITNVNGTLLFSAFDGISGNELWRSDGTSSGTTLVRDLQAGSSGSNPSSVVVINNTLFFSADDGNTGRELWRSDGTSSGTKLVSDIAFGNAGSNPRLIARINGLFYFNANDGYRGYELWRTDGTSSGTVLVSDINHGVDSGGPSGIAIGNRLFVTAIDPLLGSELFEVLDQTDLGTSAEFTISYSGSSAMDATSIDASDIRVRRVGYPNYDGRVTEVVAKVAGTGGTLTVTYRVSAPGAWDSTDNGTYQIVLQAGQVKDVNGLAASERVLGSFQVAIPDPHVFFVNTTADTPDANPGDGLALDANGQTSLRAAIMEANAFATYQTIMIPAGTYRLTRSVAGEDGASTGDLDITDDLVFLGAGATTIIDGGGLDRVFDVAAGTRVELSDLVIQGGTGVDQGGGMRIVDATATLNRVTFAGNSAVKEGGGIYSDGYLTVTDSLFANNLTTSSVGGGGGGLYNLRTATVSGTTFVNNTTPGVFSASVVGRGFSTPTPAR